MFNIRRFYIILYHTYILLQCREHIQITNNHRTIDVDTKNNTVTNDIFAFNTHKFYSTLNHTYPLLQCKEHIEITSDQSIINVEIKKQ